MARASHPPKTPHIVHLVVTLMVAMFPTATVVVVTSAALAAYAPDAPAQASRPHAISQMRTQAVQRQFALLTPPAQLDEHQCSWSARERLLADTWRHPTRTTAARP